MATTLLTLAALGNGQAQVVNRKLPQGLQQEQLEPTLKHSPVPIISSGGTAHANQSVVKYASTTSLGNCTVPSPPPSLPLSSSSSSTISSSSSSHKIVNADYSRYVKRFSNASECGSTYCKDLNYREHFHCLDCNSRVSLF